VRGLLAEHLEPTAAELRRGQLPTTDEELRRVATLDEALDRMRDAERTVQRARRANPRAGKWQEPTAALRSRVRALDRVGVLVHDITLVVAEYQPPAPRRGAARARDDEAPGRRADGLAGVVRTPYHAVDGPRPDERDRRIQVAGDASTTSPTACG
jgi:hypothetical protein